MKTKFLGVLLIVAGMSLQSAVFAETDNPMSSNPAEEDVLANAEAMPELTDEELAVVQGESYKTVVLLMREAGASWYDVYKMVNWIAGGQNGPRPPLSGKVNKIIWPALGL